MKMKLLLFIAILLAPQYGFGFAGLGDDHVKILNFSDHALIRWHYASEVCGGQRGECYEIVENKGISSFDDFPDLSGYFDIVAIPPPKQEVFLVRHTESRNWQIYDAKSKKQLLLTDNQDEALTRYKSIVRTDPVVVHAVDAEAYFKKGWKGIVYEVDEAFHMLLLIGPAILLFCSPVILFLIIFVYLITKK